MRTLWMLPVLFLASCDSGRRADDFKFGESGHGQALPVGQAQPFISTGSDSSGGGSSYQLLSDRSLFLDLYLKGADLQGESSAPPLLETETLKRRRFDVLDLTKTEAYAYALRRLEIWSAKSPQLVELIKTAMEKRSLFKYVFRPVRNIESYFLPAQFNTKLHRSKIKTVIYFDSVLGPLIHAVSWNQMGVRSQAAALIHESLRYLQITFASGMTDQQLQDLTAALILENGNRNLDVPEYLGTRLSQIISRPRAGVCDTCSFAERVELGLTFALISEVASKMRDHFPESTSTVPASKQTTEENLVWMAQYRYRSFFGEIAGLHDFDAEDALGLRLRYLSEPKNYLHSLYWSLRTVRSELRGDQFSQVTLSPLVNALNNLPFIQGGDTKPNWEMDVHRAVYPFFSTGSIYSKVNSDPEYSFGAVMESYFRLVMEPVQKTDLKVLLTCDLVGQPDKKIEVLPSSRFERSLPGWYALRVLSLNDPHPPTQGVIREAGGSLDQRAARLAFSGGRIHLTAEKNGNLNGRLVTGKNSAELKCGRLENLEELDAPVPASPSDKTVFNRGLAGCRAAAKQLEPLVTRVVWSGERTYETEAKSQVKKSNERYADFAKPVKRVIYDYAWENNAATRLTKLQERDENTRQMALARAATDPSAQIAYFLKQMERTDTNYDAAAALAELGLPQSVEPVIAFIRARDAQNLVVAADTIAGLGQVNFAHYPQLKETAESFLIENYRKGRMGALQGLLVMRTPRALAAMLEKLPGGIFGSVDELVVFGDPSVTPQIFLAALEAGGDLDFGNYVEGLVHFQESLEPETRREMFTQLVDTYFQDGHYGIGNGGPKMALAAFMPAECHW